MGIPPRTMLSATAWRVHQHVDHEHFEALRELCGAVGDKASLAMAMAGQGHDYFYQGLISEASRLAAETWTLLESVGDAEPDGRALALVDPPQDRDLGMV